MHPDQCSPKLFTVALRCGGCHEGYIATFSCAAGNSPHNTQGNLETTHYISLINEYPQAIATEAPRYLPENIERFYLQAADNVKTGNCDAASMMSRKVLEVAVKKLNPQGSGTLYKRIEQLHSSGQVTDSLKDWAHIIRDDGNDAAHEEEPVTPQFADEILSFTELFLMYTFTMPGMVDAKKSNSESAT